MSWRSLDDLALRCGCDKQRGRIGHGYIRYYEQLFNSLRKDNVKLLEIGVARGRSLWMWARFFEQGHIYGVDNCEFMDGSKYQQSRGKADQGQITFIKADQSYTVQMKKVGEKYGPFDIIIDDGSHKPQDQILTFNTLWPYCKKYYAIEDMHPAYKDHEHETVNYFARHVIGDLNSYGDKRHYDVQFNPSMNGAEWVKFIPNAIIVKRWNNAD